MVQIVVDEHVCSTLAQLDELAEIRDAAGRTIGFFHPAAPAREAGPSAKSPFSKEELDRREEYPGGRPLADILRDLERQ